MYFLLQSHRPSYLLVWPSYTFYTSRLQVIKNKKETYLTNKAKGIIPPTLDELTKVPDNEKSNISIHDTASDNVFKGFRDDLDFIDENDVGKYEKKILF